MTNVFDYKNQPSVLAKEMRRASNHRPGGGGWNAHGGTIPGLTPKSEARQKMLEPKPFRVYSAVKKEKK